MTGLLQGRTVLVTGGAGFIGSHLVDRLLEENAQRVVVLDSLAFGSKTNLAASPERLDFHSVDIGAATAHSLLPMFEGVDYVFHLAAEKHNASLGEPNRMLNTNIQGTLNVLQAATAQGVKRLVFTSSLYAYGRIAGTPFLEDEELHPSTVYGISKVAGEHLAEMFSARREIETNIIRYLFVYGPRQFANAGYKSVIVRNFERILSGQSPVVFGDGTQTLDYIYVSDAVEATLRIALNAPSGGVYNVGSGVGTSVRDLVERMREVSCCESPISYQPPDWTSGSCRVGSIQKITSQLGWKPVVGLDEGLRQVYRTIKEGNANGYRQ